MQNTTLNSLPQIYTDFTNFLNRSVCIRETLAPALRFAKQIEVQVSVAKKEQQDRAGTGCLLIQDNAGFCFSWSQQGQGVGIGAVEDMDGAAGIGGNNVGGGGGGGVKIGKAFALPVTVAKWLQSQHTWTR